MEINENAASKVNGKTVYRVKNITEEEIKQLVAEGRLYIKEK